MKRYKINGGNAAIFAAILILSIVSFANAYTGGNGSQAQPYQIASKADLLQLAASTDYNKCFILIADIDLDPNLPGGQIFTTAIIAPDAANGNYSFEGTSFSGTFDGNSHKISNFKINGNSGNHYLGLFGQVDTGGAIKNLTLENFKVNGASDSYYVGSLAGVTLNGNIKNCVSTGSVSGYYWIGGLAGYSYNGNITNSHSAGSVAGSECVGGLTGIIDGSTATHCSSTAAVNGTSYAWYVGGLAGQCCGLVSNCYSTGAVSGNRFIGGLVGDEAGGVISNCYSTGAVTGSDAVGGFAGDALNGSIIKCFSAGAVSGSSNTGGLIGRRSSASVSASFWDKDTSGKTTSAGGIDLTNEQMKQQASFTGWDFTNETTNGTNNFWRMCQDNIDYPRLNWESTAADLACQAGINFMDFAQFAEKWLAVNCDYSNNFCGGADINFSNAVAIDDFEILIDSWLTGLTY